MDLAGFRVRYTEFAQAPDALVNAILAEELLNVSDSWATRLDQVHGLRTAHALAIHPQARNTRKQGQDDTEYAKKLKELEAAHAFARSRIL